MAKRTGTLAKVRQTLSRAATEVGDTVVDASSLPIANVIESIVCTLQKHGTADWGSLEVEKEKKQKKKKKKKDKKEETKEDEDEEPPDNSRLTLCEAFVLLWQNTKSGSIEGRRTSTALQAICYGCSLCDLLHLGKIDLQHVDKKLAGVKWDRYIVHPTGPDPLENFLDEMFIPIAEAHDKGDRNTLSHHIENVAISLSEGKFVVDVVINNLIERKILKEVRHGMMGKCLWKTFPSTEGNEVKKKLVDRLRSVLLDGAERSIFETYLLRFVQLADKDFTLKSPFLSGLLSNGMEKAKAKDILEACIAECKQPEEKK